MSNADLAVVLERRYFAERIFLKEPFGLVSQIDVDNFDSKKVFGCVWFPYLKAGAELTGCFS